MCPFTDLFFSVNLGRIPLMKKSTSVHLINFRSRMNCHVEFSLILGLLSSGYFNLLTLQIVSDGLVRVSCSIWLYSLLSLLSLNDAG